MPTSSALTNIKEYSETRIVFLGTACHVFTDNFVSQKRELEEKEHTSLNLYMNYDDMLYIVGMNSTTEDHYIYIMSTTRSFAAKFCHFAQRDGVERESNIAWELFMGLARGSSLSSSDRPTPLRHGHRPYSTRLRNDQTFIR